MFKLSCCDVSPVRTALDRLHILTLLGSIHQTKGAMQSLVFFIVCHPLSVNVHALNALLVVYNQGILWYGIEYGMEGKNGYGIWNCSSMEWKIWCMEWNESSIFHTNSILPHFDMVLLKVVFHSVEHISRQCLNATRTVIRKLRAFLVISVTNSNVDAKMGSLILILFSWGQGTLSSDFRMFTSVLPACHCVRRDSNLASIQCCHLGFSKIN